VFEEETGFFFFVLFLQQGYGVDKAYFIKVCLATIAAGGPRALRGLCDFAAHAHAHPANAARRRTWRSTPTCTLRRRASRWLASSFSAT
jgi:hypothetical protein